MKTINLQNPLRTILRQRKMIIVFVELLFFISLFQISTSLSQSVLFDFDNAPLHTSLPIVQTVSGITAHFSATGQGFSIQEANVMGFTPQGFAGLCIYPNSINLSDLIIRFEQKLTDFSIMYSCQELGCDDAATMRVTAYNNGNLVGYDNKIAANPGTWPVDTLSCSFPQGFDSVIVHYQSRPPTCKDFGTIFMADNMQVTVLSTNIEEDDIGKNGGGYICLQNIPNPGIPNTTIIYRIREAGNACVKVFDIFGNEITTLVNQNQEPGIYSVLFDSNKYSVSTGIYFYQMVSRNYSEIKKMIICQY